MGVNPRYQLRVQPEKTYLEFGGCKYYVRPKIAVLCDMLLKAGAQPVQRWRLMGVIGASDGAEEKTVKNVLNVYLNELRRTVEPLGYIIFYRNGEYRMFMDESAQTKAA